MNYAAAPSSTFVSGGGEMGQLIQSLDWSKTSLGAMSQWSQSLKTTVQLMLNSRYPMFIWWGGELTNLYNDAYIPILSQRHPWALGESAPKVWSEIWNDVGPLAAIVLQEGRATWNEELMLFMERNGFVEECYFTFSYSPIHNDDGSVGGVFCACTEDTRQVIGERRLQTLRHLGERSLTEAQNLEQTCQAAAKTLAENSKDIPFFLLYLLDEDGKTARLYQTTLLQNEQRAAPPLIQLTDPQQDTWDFQQVIAQQKAQRFEHLEEKFGKLPALPWTDDWTRRAMVLPLARPGNPELPAGFLVAGISPRLFFDQDYVGFVELVAGHIATAIANTRAREEERRRAEALYQLDLAKTTFFSNVSHEFRTPLTLLLSPLEDLLHESSKLSALATDKLAMAHRNGMRLLKLVNNLLDFSRIQTNRIQARYEPLDLATLTADLASVFRAAIEKAGLQLHVDTPPLPEPVYVDREMWEKIVLNLLSNAFKYTLEGHITVQLRHDEHHAILQIKDTGIGIPAMEIPHIFQRFHRVAQTQGRTHEGTGIGLSLVQELVQLHSGVILVQSELGVGSIFTVQIPFGKAHLPAEFIVPSNETSDNLLVSKSYLEEALRWYNAGNGVDAPIPGEASASAKKPLVLIADDNADMRDYLQKLLSRHFNVATVHNGTEAWQFVQQQLPDLVLSDIMMPQLNGIDLVKNLKENPHTALVPVILLSARAGEEARIDGLEAGADDYLIKPFSAKELVTRVQTHLKIAQTRRQAQQQLYNLFMQAPALIAILRGREGRCELFNPLFSKLWNNRDVVGKTMREAWPELEGQGWFEIVESVFDIGEAVFGDEYPAVADWKNDGHPTKAFFNFVYAPFYQDGQIDGTMIFGFEVTEQVLARKKVEESEERYRTLFTSMDEGFCVIEMIFDDQEQAIDYRFLEVNPTFEKQTGLQKPMGKTARELVPDLEAYWFEIYGKVALTGEPTRFLNGSDAMGRWFDVYAYRVGEADKRKVGILFSDITERKHSEQALQASYQFNQDVLDSLAEHLAVLDKDGYITSINAAWRRFAVENGADWTMREVGVGANYLEVCQVENDPDATVIYQGIKNVLDGKQKFFSVEYPCHAPDTQRWFLLTVSPLTHGGGGAVVSHLNITTRRLAEEALRDNEERLRIATESAELGTWDFNPHTGELLWDLRTKELFGLPADANVTYTIFLQGLHPDDRSRTDQVVQAVLQGKNNGTYDIQYRTLGIEDQKLRWIRAKGKAFFDQNGKATRFIGTVLDITHAKLYESHLQRSEELFRRLAEDVPVKIWLTQPDGSCTYLNKQWYNYTGQRPENALGFGWLDAVHPDDLEQSRQIFLNANMQQIPFSFEYRLRSKEGSYRWKMDAGTPRFGEDGSYEGHIGTVVDIHERKLAAEQKDAFMRIAGHELRTPLTSLVGYLSLMLKAPENSEAVINFAKKSYESALKMRGLISDFLDFSRAQQGELSFQISEFDFDALATETIDNMQLSFPRHRIRLEGTTGKIIQGDRGRIEQVITNLLNNAIKYSPGQDLIDVHLSTKKRTIVLKIKDYGMGIEQTELSRIFSKFHRAANTGNIKGMGLGLYIVKEIVDFHRGTISVESTPGEGTCFTVTLPTALPT